MSRNISVCLICLLTLLFANPTTVAAEVTVPSILASHMIVQREKTVRLWGMTTPGENVAATFRGNRASVAADALGRWNIYLPPGAAGGPFTLTIQGTNAITLTNVLVGDLWVASGQSNMEFPMAEFPKATSPQSRGTSNAATEIAVHYPTMRLYHVEHAAATYPMPDVAASTWTACTPQSVADFSAVAYFFGRDLR